MFITLCTSHIIYLEIKSSPRLSELLNHHFIPLLQSIQNHLEQRLNLPLSFSGRAVTITMKILPQMNELFSVLPIQPTTDWFMSLDSKLQHLVGQMSHQE